MGIPSFGVLYLQDPHMLEPQVRIVPHMDKTQYCTGARVKTPVALKGRSLLDGDRGVLCS